MIPRQLKCPTFIQFTFCAVGSPTVSSEVSSSSSSFSHSTSGPSRTWAVAFLQDSGLLPKSKRKLVSKLQIRWWNYINDEGESTWVFESRAKEDQHRLSTTEVSFFHPSNPGLYKMQGVNILDGSRCCPCFLDSLLFHCNLLPKAEMACLGGEYFISIQYCEEILNLLFKVIGLSLSLSNLLGYLRCRLGRTESTSALISGVANQYLQVKHKHTF